MIIIDELLRKMKRGGLPPLAVGMGIYLPMALTLLIPLGALLGWFYDKWARANFEPRVRSAHGRAAGYRAHRRREHHGRGLCFDRGGDRSDAPLALIAENPWAVPLGLVIFIVVVLAFYAWTRRETKVALAA